jgi:hypothetical protein
MKEAIAYCHDFQQGLRHVRLGWEWLHVLSVRYVVLK